MAADCKSATHSSYGGSNPPLCTIKQGFREQGLGIKNPILGDFWNGGICHHVGEEVLGGAGSVCGFGSLELVYPRCKNSGRGQVGGTEVGSTGHHRRAGVTHHAGHEGGEDPPEEQFLAVTLSC
jgi:hypothetical protein